MNVTFGGVTGTLAIVALPAGPGMFSQIEPIISALVALDTTKLAPIKVVIGTKWIGRNF